MVKGIENIKKLIWVYFVLLLLEGALRKWLLPSLATPLLIVRDPIVLLVYAYAYQVGIFPRNWFMLCGVIIAFASLAAGVFAPGNTVFVALYGFRANFLHLPLIFIMGRVLDFRDVQKFGYWTLLTSIPMALLMALQFQAPSNSWLNAGASEGAVQISSALGHVRSSGTFSFISGPIAFYPLVTAFLLESQFSNVRRYPLWLLLLAGAGLTLAIAVSGSRTLVANVAIVVVMGIAASCFLQPQLAWRGLRVAAILVVLWLIALNVPVFQDALYVFSARVDGASRSEGGSTGFLDRFLGFFLNPIALLWNSPLFGAGLGMGTTAGSSLLTGQVQFLLAEEEWSRIILESGPILGTLFLLFRTCLTFQVGWDAVRQAKLNNMLPILMFAVCALMVLTGSFGQPTTLGFTCFITGLCLASMRVQPGIQNQASASTMA